MKARIKFRKNGVMKFIGHLDLMRYFQKAMRRADIPIAYSGGFSPHMIMSFAQPLGVGLTSDAEYMDIELKEPIASKQAIAQLNQVMVEGMEVIGFVEIPTDKKSAGMSIVAAADYMASLIRGQLPEDHVNQIRTFFAQPEIKIMKKTKRSELEVDIKPMIYTLTAKADGIFLSLASGSAENLKPSLVMEAFAGFAGLNTDTAFHYHRTEIYAVSNGTLVPLDSLGSEITL